MRYLHFCSAFDKLSFTIFIEVSYSKCSYLLLRSLGDKDYQVTLGSEVFPVYCHMTDDLGACGGSGWTLVMKIDGNQVCSPYCLFTSIFEVFLVLLLNKTITL